MSQQVPETAISSPPLPSLTARALGILTAPRQTFSLVKADPRWAGMLLLVTLVVAFCQAAFLATETGRQALLDQQVATLEGFGVQITDQQYALMQDRLTTAAYAQVAAVLVGSPLLSVLLAGVLFVVFTTTLGGVARFGQVLAVVVHAGAVSAAQQLVVTPLNFLRETMSSPTNLAAFLTALDEGSFLGILLGSVDLFVVWWVIVLAIGLAVLYQRPTGPVAVALLAAYATIGLVVAGIRTALGGA